MLELWLIRHGATDWNAQGRILGHKDMPLSELGQWQARRLAQRFARAATRFDAVYASDLTRARVTAETALPYADVRLDPRLRELDYGVFEGASWESLSADLASLARHWREEPYTRRIPDGESYDDVFTRFASFRADLPATATVAAFTHGGTVRAALYGLMGRPRRGTWRVEIENTGLTRLWFDERGVTVVATNDHAHLDPG